ncbi:hypothetical protein RHSIM_RhsimUnG0215500 [Rhododendron simsii]|uniref:Uncharacterized protein n=1 Tax=Rhododendron simsii TaxID=118357 RepID=A0A834L3H7_RHOSS|nr:hypothetical protein RHSIM_RhsimUnG0215500 [Rhododendron simsii]
MAIKIGSVKRRPREQISHKKRARKCRSQKVLNIQLLFRIMDNQNMSVVIKISFKNLLNEIVDKFDVAPPISPHTKKIDAEQEVAKIAIEHLKDMFNFEVDDFNLHDKEMYRQHLEQVDFALVEALQENKALKDEIAKI